MRYLMGIDQGGTKTDAVIVREDGLILGRGDDRAVRSPNENYVASQARFIRHAAESAAMASGIAMDNIDRVVAALNGADWPHDYPRLTALAAQALDYDESRITVVNDCIAAMRGGTEEKRCAVLCVGTGLNCAVRSETGEEYVYGYFVADCDQGGSALGRDAWLAMIDEWTGLGPPTRITREALDHYRMPDTQALYIAFTDGRLPMQPKNMAPLLMRAAEAGDAVALGIVNRMSGRLAKYVSLGMKKLGIDGQPLPLVISGGATKSAGHVLTRAIERDMAALAPQVRCISARLEPVAGSALLALDALYPGGMPDRIRENFEQSAQAMGLLRGQEGDLKQP